MSLIGQACFWVHMKTINGIIVILLLSILLAFANFLLNNNRIAAKVAEITLAEVENLQERLVVVDARSRKDYKTGHIENAVNLPAEDFENSLAAFFELWQPDCAVLVYCSANDCNAGRAVADKLRNEFNIKKVFVLKGDWQKWKTSKN